MLGLRLYPLLGALPLATWAVAITARAVHQLLLVTLLAFPELLTQCCCSALQNMLTSFLLLHV
jgi:hypothetical protein